MGDGAELLDHQFLVDEDQSSRPAHKAIVIEALKIRGRDAFVVARPHLSCAASAIGVGLAGGGERRETQPHATRPTWSSGRTARAPTAYTMTDQGGPSSPRVRGSARPHSEGGSTAAQAAPTPRPCSREVNPRHQWDRPLQAPAHEWTSRSAGTSPRHAYSLGGLPEMEARVGAVSFRRKYAIYRGKVIGGGARQITSWGLLNGKASLGGDFGSAARHHRLIAADPPRSSAGRMAA